MIINIGNSKIANEPEKLKEFTNIQLIYLAIVTVVSGLLTFILWPQPPQYSISAQDSSR